MIGFGNYLKSKASANAGALAAMDKSSRKAAVALFDNLRDSKMDAAWAQVSEMAGENTVQLSELFIAPARAESKQLNNQGFVDFLFAIAKQNPVEVIGVMDRKDGGGKIDQLLLPDWIANAMLTTMRAGQEYISILMILEAEKSPLHAEFLEGMSRRGIVRSGEARGGPALARMGNTPLREAIALGCEEAACSLIAAGVELEPPLRDGSLKEPAALASALSECPLFELTVRHGLKRAQLALIDRMFSGDASRQSREIRKNFNGLRLAARHGQTEAALAIVGRGASPLERMEAIPAGSLPILSELIIAGMDEAAERLIMDWSQAGREGAAALSLRAPKARASVEWAAASGQGEPRDMWDDVKSALARSSDETFAEILEQMERTIGRAEASMGDWEPDRANNVAGTLSRRPAEGMSALAIAIALGRERLALMLVEAGASVDGPASNKDERGLVEAARTKGLQLVAMAIEERMRGGAEGKLMPRREDPYPEDEAASAGSRPALSLKIQSRAASAREALDGAERESAVRAPKRST